MFFFASVFGVCLFVADLVVASCDDDVSVSLEEEEPEPLPLLEELLLELPELEPEDDSEVLRLAT